MAEVVGYSVEDNSDIEKSVIDAAKKHFNNGDYASALKLYLGLLKTSASARLYFDVGLCYYKKNDYDKAIEYLSQAVNLDINNSTAYSYLGNCYFRKLDAKSAVISGLLFGSTDNTVLITCTSFLKFSSNIGLIGLSI